MPNIDPAGVVQTPLVVAELETLLKRVISLLSAVLLSASAPKATPESAAPADVHCIVAEMKTLVDGLDRRAEERNTELFEHIKAQERKVDASKGRNAKREYTYSFEARALVPIIWEEANRNELLKSNLTTRMTYKAAYDYYKNRLLPVGIESWKSFKGCLRSAREIARRDAKLAAAEKPAPTPNV